jgi:hypothetical protein
MELSNPKFSYYSKGEYFFEMSKKGLKEWDKKSIRGSKRVGPINPSKIMGVQYQEDRLWGHLEGDVGIHNMLVGKFGVKP